MANINTTLEYRNKYPIYSILTNNTNLKPGLVYNTTYFLEELTFTLQKQAGIVCNGTLLSQVELCLNLTTGILLDCPKHEINMDNCPNGVYY